jgi:predicted lysophospholipase L1 biosynthesis ABC-type transport system permease subunit
MKLLKKLKHEFLLILPPTLFFFFAFLLLSVTQRLIQREYGLPLSGFGGALVGALIVGKVVLIADNLPLMNQFPDKPLLYNIAWKSAIYFAATFLFRYAEHLFPLLREYGALTEAHRRLMAKVVWPHFWVIQMWLAVLFFLYCSLRELVLVVGRDKIIRLFLVGNAGQG